MSSLRVARSASSQFHSHSQSSQPPPPRTPTSAAAATRTNQNTPTRRAATTNTNRQTRTAQPTTATNNTTTTINDDDDDDYQPDESESAAAAALRAERLERLLRGEDPDGADAPSGGQSVPASSRPIDSVAAPTATAPSSSDLYSELHSYLDELQRKVDLADGFDDGTGGVGSVWPGTAMEILHPINNNPPTPRRTNEPIPPPITPTSRTSASSSSSSSYARTQLESKELDPPSTGRARSPFSPSSHTLPAASSPRATPAVRPHTSNEEEKTMVDNSFDGMDGDDGEYVPPVDGNFDELREMEKIAELDALLADAETRSAEMEQRLHALMSAPLPTLEAGAPEVMLQLMPGSPTSANEFPSASSPTSTSDPHGAATNSSNDFFMTSVPVGSDAPLSPTGRATGMQSRPAGGDSQPDATDDLWQLEQVEPLDAPLILGEGEGFRPSAEDQGKLDEIDALLNHFRSSDTRLPAAYRPRFTHPPIKKKRNTVGGVKKKATNGTTNNAASATTPTSAASTSLVPVIDGDTGDDDGDDSHDLVPFDPATIPSRVSALVPSLDPSMSLLVGGGSLLDVALASPTDSAGGEVGGLELSEEEQSEMRRWNKAFKKLQAKAQQQSSSSHTTNSSSSSRSSASTNSQQPIDSEYLKQLLAKTQASNATRINNVNGTSSSTATNNNFPIFDFHKTTPPVSTSGGVVGINNLHLRSTDAIFAALEAEDRARARAKREARRGNGTTTVVGETPSTSINTVSEDDSNRQSIDPDVEREMSTAMDDENDVDDYDDANGGGVGDGLDSDDDDPGTILGVDMNGQEVSSNPKVRMDKLSAQVAAIRARVFDEAAEFDDMSEGANRHAPAAHAPSGSSSSSSHLKGRSSRPGSSATAHLIATTARPNSQPATSTTTTTTTSSIDDLDDSFGSDSPEPSPRVNRSVFSATGPFATPPPLSASYSAGVTSSGVHSLADRLDRAVSLHRPGSSSSVLSTSRSGSDSWRTWQPRDDAGGEFASPGSAAHVRVAARQASAGATYGTHRPSASSTSSLTVRPPSRPLRVLPNGGGSTIHSARATGPHTPTHHINTIATLERAPRSRPVSASSIIDLPPPISSNKLQSRQQQLSKTATWK